MELWESTGQEDPSLDYHWITDRLAVGAGIWTRGNMEKLAADGVTHVVDMLVEFDDTLIADGTGIAVFWNPCDDDLQEKSPELFRHGVEFAMRAYQEPGSRIYFHCSAGVHRGPMMLLAFLGAQGMDLDKARELIRLKRLESDFPEVYCKSVERFLKAYRK